MSHEYLRRLKRKCLWQMSNSKGVTRGIQKYIILLKYTKKNTAMNVFDYPGHSLLISSQESGSFCPWVVSPGRLALGRFALVFGVGRFALIRWVVSPVSRFALGRFAPIYYKAHTDIQIDKLDGGREGEMGGWIDGWIIDIIRPIRTDRQNGWMDGWMDE